MQLAVAASKTFKQIAIILDRIATHNYTRHGGDQSEGLNMGNPLSYHLTKENHDHDQMMVVMSTNIVLLTMKLTEAE
ncbi:hypothetical protein HAX54_033432, partial [Datura stramonium]|nr:hypothetical protein [Datura stramonium]